MATVIKPLGPVVGENGPAGDIGTPDIHWSRMGEPGAFEDFMHGFLRPHSGAVFDPIYTDGPAHGKGVTAFNGAVILPNGRALLAPGSSPNIGLYDPRTNTYIDGPAHGKGAAAFLGAVLLPDGRALLAPSSSPNIGLYDYRTNTYADGPAHGKGAALIFPSAVLLPDGRALLVPQDTPNIGLVHLFGLDVGLGYCLHPFINKR